MSTLKGDGESLLDENPMPIPIKPMNAAQEAEEGPAINDVFMGCSSMGRRGTFLNRSIFVLFHMKETFRPQTQGMRKKGKKAAP